MVKNNLKVAEVSLRDIRNIFNLLEGQYSVYFNYDISKFYQKALFNHILGIYDNDALVAAAIITKDNDIPAFVVKKSEHGKGLGRLLMKEVISKYGSPLTLQVHQDNLPARQLYTSFGFTESLSSTHIYDDGTYCIDCKFST